MRQMFANQLAIVIGAMVLITALTFALIQSTGALGITQGPLEVPAPLIPHPVIGYLDCRSCHDLDGIVPFPPDHFDYANAVCTGCHIPSGAETFPVPAADDEGEASEIPHPVEGFEDCISCHNLDGDVPYPPDHVDYDNTVCTNCHLPSGAETFPEQEEDENSQTLPSGGLVLSRELEPLREQ
jgi:hypothetical protein